MQDYNKIAAYCQRMKDFSPLLEGFLIHYAVERNKLDREFDRRFAKYAHVTSKLQKSWKEGCKVQYIAHGIFKAGGLINKYLNHSAFKNLSQDEREFLQLNATTPWRFSFSFILDSPATDFYNMVDVFTDEEFLLYSPSVKILINKNHPLLWMNLIGFNGQCWETFGPLTGFASFDPDDIFFFATELNPEIISQEELLLDLETNPVPYMMLFSGSGTPGMRHKEFELVHVIGEFPVTKPDMEKLKRDFSIDHKKHVYRLTNKKLSGMPHFAEAYYDEEDEFLFLTAMTQYGFDSLNQLLSKYDSDILPDPEISVHPSMLATASDILKKKIELNPYSRLFETPPDPETADEVEKLNHLMELALPFINSGKSPDLNAFAEQVGLDPVLAAEVYQKMVGQVKKMKKP